MDFWSAAGIVATTKGTIFRRDEWSKEDNPFFKKHLKFDAQGDVVFEDGKKFNFFMDEIEYRSPDWDAWQIGRR